MKGSELFSINSKWHNKEHHIKIKVPPLGATFIKGKNLKKIKYEMDKGKKILIGGLSQDIKRINNSKILVKKKKL